MSVILSLNGIIYCPSFQLLFVTFEKYGLTFSISTFFVTIDFGWKVNDLDRA